MFTSARIKLTTWYLLIIMLISIMFSVTLYRILTSELDRGFQRISARYTQEYGPVPTPVRPEFLEHAYLQASEERIAWTLVYINLIILVVSGVGGYILAGITLKPIRVMIDEQNRFITDASHELRTPLTSLRSEIEVYLRGKKHTPEEAQALLQSNLEEVAALQTLSDSLIELAQKEKSPYTKSFATVSLLPIVQSAVKKFQTPAKQKDITIKTKVTNETVCGDEERLIQLFGIFLDNAIKYSPKKTTVTIATKRVDGFVSISITDQGVGIDEKDIPHIFDRFYRADSSRSKQTIPGYGLGLSMAQKIIVEHGGSITVKSKEKKGTTFTIRFSTFSG